MSSKQSRINAVYKRYDTKILEKASKNNLITKDMNPSQVNQILLGCVNLGANKMRLFNDPSLSHNHMMVIRVLLEAGIQYSRIKYALDTHEDYNFAHKEFFIYVMARLVSSDNTDLIVRYMRKDPYRVIALYEKFLPIVKKNRLNNYTKLLFDMNYYCAKIQYLIDNPGEKSI